MHEKWKEIFEKKAEYIEQYSEPFLKDFGKDKEELHNAFRHLGFCLDDFKEWVNLSNKTKQLMEKGVINFDVIKEETLLGIIIMESMTIEELMNVWNPDPETDQT